MCLKRFLALISAAIMLMSLASCTLDPVDNSSRSDSSASSGEPSDADSSEPSESSDSSSEPDAPNGELSPVRLKKLDVFYAPKQASCVYTVDISGLDADTVAALRLLQGLAARYDTAALYLIGGDSDRFWRDYCNGEIGVYFKAITPEQAAKRYLKLIKSLVIYTPDTFEYETALNLAFRRQALAVTAEVADALFSPVEERYDIRGIYADKKSAYEAVLTEVGEDFEFISLAGGYAEFDDYAFAVGALKLELSIDVDWEREMLVGLLSKESVKRPGVVLCTERSDRLRQLLGGCGFGLLNVHGFANATVLSSVTVSTKGVGKTSVLPVSTEAQTVNVSFVMTSDSLGDTLNSDYLTWTKTNPSFPVAYSISLSICELAPPVAMWYDANCVNNNRLVASGYTDMDERACSYDDYRAWHSVNNKLLSSFGLSIAATYTLREDIAYGENYGDWSAAAGIAVLDSTGDGSVWTSGPTPVIASVRVKTPAALEKWLSSVSAQGRAKFCIVELEPKLFYETLTLDLGDFQTRQLTVDEVVTRCVSLNDSLRLAPIDTLFSRGKDFAYSVNS